MEGDRIEAIVQVALVLGLRQGELLGLRWEDVDLEDERIAVRQSLARNPQAPGGWRVDSVKSARSRRTIAAPPALMANLLRHRTQQYEEQLRAGSSWQNDKGLVFVDEMGRPLHGSTVTKRFQQLLADARLPRMRFHDLRHGAATLMISSGENIRVVMARLGHAQVSTTLDIYSHVAPQADREVAERLGNVLLERPPSLVDAHRA